MFDYRWGRLIAVLALVAMSGCTSRAAKNQKLHQQFAAKCKEAADLMAGISDAASAKAAEPRLKVVFRDLDKINQELEEHYDSEDVDPTHERVMSQAVIQGIVEFQRMTGETHRLSKNLEAIGALGETWKMNPCVAMLKTAGGAGGVPRPE